MSDELRETVALTLKARPWMLAESESIWLVSGTYGGDRGTFIDCLAYRLPDYVTGGSVVFQMFPPLQDFITPEEIARGREYVLVPRESSNSGEQR